MSHAGRPHFDTTQWSLVVAAGGDDSSSARRALAGLYELYWDRLRDCVRLWGHTADEAEDLTQAFFTRLLEHDELKAARRDRGRFRSFLLAALSHFVLNDARDRRRVKRGGDQPYLSIPVQTADGYPHEPIDTQTPERIFDRCWARAVIDRVMARLRAERVAAGDGVAFEHLKACLTLESPEGGYREWGQALGLSEGAVKSAVHDLRRRYRHLLRREVARTVATKAEVDAEIQYLIRALQP
jgi:DNA-directed RNA polymerase specialized sigma24 family protein